MRDIKLKPLVKKCAIYYSYLGLAIGIIMFIYSFFSKEFAFNVGSTKVFGIAAGAIALFFCPIIMAIVGVTHAPIIWYPALLLFGCGRAKK